MILHTNHYIRTIMKKNLLSLGGSAFATFLFIFSFSSCHDEEVENVSELAYRHAYEDNFVKNYGEVNPNQTWDFSSYAKRYKLNGALTRATMDDDTYKSIATIVADEKNYYQVPSDLSTFITNRFPEHQDNASKTQAFTLMADKACSFEVAYVYQGRSEPDYDLYYAIYNLNDHSLTKTKIFSKGNVYVSNDGTSYEELGTTWGVSDAPSTMDYSYVRTETERIDVPANSFVYFYIKITDTSTRQSGTQDNPQFGWIGDELASIDDPHTIGLVPITTPANIKAVDPSYEAYLLAVDDFCLTCLENNIITENHQDFQDFNDVLFLIAGNIPEPSTVEPGVIKTTISKRYMIEDLYAYDYDFNDIVVDATQLTTMHYLFYHPTKTNPNGRFEIQSDQTTVEQSATMKHLCGTLPFQITLGNYTFGKVTDPTNEDQTMAQLNGTATTSTTTPAGTKVNGWEPDFTVEDQQNQPIGWVPSENNISASIITEKGTNTKDGLWPGEWTGAWTSQFPAAGDVPYIIAVDQTVNWRDEEVSIPKEWIGGDMSSTDTTNSSSSGSGN